MNRPTDPGSTWPIGRIWEWIYHGCTVVVALELGLILLGLILFARSEWLSLRRDAAEYRAIRRASQELEALFAQGRQAVITRLNQR